MYANTRVAARASPCGCTFPFYILSFALIYFFKKYETLLVALLLCCFLAA